MRAPFYEETLVEISPSGEILRELSLLEILYNSGWENVLIESTEGLGDDGILRDLKGHVVEFELLLSEGSQTASGIATTLMENMRTLGIIVTLSYLDFSTLVSRVTDTFDYEAAMENEMDRGKYNGRGVPLVRSLCDSIAYSDEGRCVEVSYVWQYD